MKSICLAILASAALLFAQTVVAKPPSWDTVKGGKGRFILLKQFDSAAVLDQETGLVWEQSPSTSTFNWNDAQLHCNDLTVGNRKGWRLPTLQELASLVDGDPANTISPRLPPGHPFSNVQSSYYWSATTRAGNTSNAWVVFFNNGLVDEVSKSNFLYFTWCVRGGQGVDPQ